MVRKRRMVATWRDSLRWYSQRVNVALMGVAPVWLMLPEDMRSAIPPTWLAGFAAVMGLAGFVGRLVAQDEPPAPGA